MIVDDNFKNLTSLVKIVAKLKPRKNDHVFELNISYLKRIKFLVTEKYVIGIDAPRRRIFSVLDRDDFVVKKIKKVLIEKKYVVELELNHKKIKTVMPIRDFEKLEKLSLVS